MGPHTRTIQHRPALPLHSSDALRFITGLALITRAGWAINICSFWGLTLNLESIITTDLNYFELSALEFTQFWFFHIVVFIVPITFAKDQVKISPQLWRSGYSTLSTTVSTVYTALSATTNTGVSGMTARQRSGNFE